MITASITETKNRLSALLDRVRHGQVVLIMDRGTPVARIESVVTGADIDAEGRGARLERQGLMTRGRRPAPRRLMAQRPPRLREGTGGGD